MLFIRFVDKIRFPTTHHKNSKANSLLTEIHFPGNHLRQMYRVTWDRGYHPDVSCMLFILSIIKTLNSLY